MVKTNASATTLTFLFVVYISAKNFQDDMHKLSKIDGQARLEQLLKCSSRSKFAVYPLHFLFTRLYSFNFLGWTRFQKGKVRKTTSLNSKLRKGTLLQTTWKSKDIKAGPSKYSELGSYSSKFKHRSDDSAVADKAEKKETADFQSKEWQETYEIFNFPSTTDPKTSNIQVEDITHPSSSKSIALDPKNNNSVSETNQILEGLAVMLVGEKPVQLARNGSLKTEVVKESLEKPTVENAMLSQSKAKENVGKPITMTALTDLDKAHPRDVHLLNADSDTAGTGRSGASENYIERAGEKEAKAREVSEFLNDIADWRKNDSAHANAQYFMQEKDRLGRFTSAVHEEDIAVLKGENNEKENAADHRKSPTKAEKYKINDKDVLERKIKRSENSARKVANHGEKHLQWRHRVAGDEIQEDKIDEVENEQSGSEATDIQGLSKENDAPRLLSKSRNKDKQAWVMRSNYATDTTKGRTIATVSGGDCVTSDKEKRAWLVCKVLDQITAMKSPKPITNLKMPKTEISKALEENYSKIHRPTEEAEVPREFKEILGAASDRKTQFFQSEVQVMDDLDSIFSENNKEANEICNLLNKLSENYRRKKTSEQFRNSPIRKSNGMNGSKPLKHFSLTDAERATTETAAAKNSSKASKPEIQSIILKSKLKSKAEEKGAIDSLQKYNDDLIPVELFEDVFKGKDLTQSNRKDKNGEEVMTGCSEYVFSALESQLSPVSIKKSEMNPGLSSTTELPISPGALRTSEPQLGPNTLSPPEGQMSTNVPEPPVRADPSSDSTDTDYSPYSYYSQQNDVACATEPFETKFESTVTQPKMRNRKKEPRTKESALQGVSSLNIIMNDPHFTKDIQSGIERGKERLAPQTLIVEGTLVKCSELVGETDDKSVQNIQETINEIKDELQSQDDVLLPKSSPNFVILYSEGTEEGSGSKPLAIIGSNFVLPFPENENPADFMSRVPSLVRQSKMGNETSARNLDWASKRGVGSLANHEEKIAMLQPEEHIIDEDKTNQTLAARPEGSEGKNILVEKPQVSRRRFKDAFEDVNAFTYEERKGISELKINFTKDDDRIAPVILHEVLHSTVKSAKHEISEQSHVNKESTVEQDKTLRAKERGKISRVLMDADFENDKSLCEELGLNSSTYEPEVAVENDSKATLSGEKDKKTATGIESMEKDDIVRVLHKVLDDVMQKTVMRKDNNNPSDKDGSKETEDSVKVPSNPVSDAVLIVPDTEVGPGASKKSKYKNPEYYSYHKDSYHEAEVELQKYRLPQPTSKKNGGDSKK